MNKKRLQIFTTVMAIIPVITGIIGLSGIRDPIYGEIRTSNNILLDSNLRFFAGVWLGLGLTLFSIVRKIDEHTLIFRIVWTCIFLGGLGRIFSIIFIGVPPIPFIGFTILEIVGAPIFIYWQNRIKS